MRFGSCYYTDFKNSFFNFEEVIGGEIECVFKCFIFVRLVVGRFTVFVVRFFGW